MNTDSETLSKKTLPQLRELCKQRGLKTSGNKAQLIERLSAAAPAPTKPQAQEAAPAAVDPAFVTPKKERKRKAEHAEARGVDELESPENVSKLAVWPHECSRLELSSTCMSVNHALCVY